MWGRLGSGKRDSAGRSKSRRVAGGPSQQAMQCPVARTAEEQGVPATSNSLCSDFPVSAEPGEEARKRDLNASALGAQTGCTHSGKRHGNERALETWDSSQD